MVTGALPRVLVVDWLPSGEVRGRVEDGEFEVPVRDTVVTRDGERVACSCPSGRGDCPHVRALRDRVRERVLADMGTVERAIEAAPVGEAGHLLRALAGLDDWLGRIQASSAEAREARTARAVEVFGERSGR